MHRDAEHCVRGPFTKETAAMTPPRSSTQGWLAPRPSGLGTEAQLYPSSAWSRAFPPSPSPERVSCCPQRLLVTSSVVCSYPQENISWEVCLPPQENSKLVLSTFFASLQKTAAEYLLPRKSYNWGEWKHKAQPSPSHQPDVWCSEPPFV